MIYTDFSNLDGIIEVCDDRVDFAAVVRATHKPPYVHGNVPVIRGVRLYA